MVGPGGPGVGDGVEDEVGEVDGEPFQRAAGEAPGRSPSGSSRAPSPESTGSSPKSSTGTKTFTGDTVQTRWGPVQVRVTLENGKITDVTAIAHPSDNPKDQEINSYAIPQLRREALAAQSAEIDSVSGATYTSEDYQQPLQSALDSAGL